MEKVVNAIRSFVNGIKEIIEIFKPSKKQEEKNASGVYIEQHQDGQNNTQIGIQINYRKDE